MEVATLMQILVLLAVVAGVAILMYYYLVHARRRAQLKPIRVPLRKRH